MKKGQILKKVRELQGITQIEIARKLGIDQTSINKIENNISALNKEYISKICKILSINEEFLYNKSDYLFIPKSFLKFRVKGLKARVSPFAWLDLISGYSSAARVLLLVRENKASVLCACVKDDRDSIFFVRIDIPLTFQKVFDYIKELPNNKRDNIPVLVKSFFDRLDVAGIYHSFDAIAHYDRNAVNSLIEEAFVEVLTDKEKELILKIREKSIDPHILIRYIKRLSN